MNKRFKHDNHSMSSSEVSSSSHHKDDSDDDDYDDDDDDSDYKVIKPKLPVMHTYKMSHRTLDNNVTKEEINMLFASTFDTAGATACCGGGGATGAAGAAGTAEGEEDFGYFQFDNPPFIEAKQPNAMFKSLYLVFVSYCLSEMSRLLTTPELMRKETEEKRAKYNQIMRNHIDLSSKCFPFTLPRVSYLVIRNVEQDLEHAKWYKLLTEMMNYKTMISFNTIEIRDKQPRTCFFTKKKINRGYAIVGRDKVGAHSYNASPEVAVFYAHYLVVKYYTSTVENFIATLKQNYYEENASATQLECMISIAEYHNENHFSHIDTIWAYIYRSLWYLVNEKYLDIE